MTLPNDSNAVVHINVPKHLKNAWVRASAEKHMKLTDWLLERIAFPAPVAAECGNQDLDRLLVLAGLTLPDFANAVGVDLAIAERWRVGNVPSIPLEMLQLLAGVHPTMRLIKR